MNTRHIFITLVTIVLIAAVFAGVVLTGESHADSLATVTSLQNVRDYASAPSAEDTSYAIDGGLLYKGSPLAWTKVETPADVIVNAVAIDALRPETLYIGAANELAIYRSTDGGDHWLRVPLTTDYVGAVTDIAVDGAQRIVYVGTDTAGLFRLRDVGSSVVLNGQLLLDEPVREVVVSSTGSGLAFARTDWNLYRAENFGLNWVTVDNLFSSPTALAIAETSPETVYVGTMDRGVVASTDGQTWTLVNEGLGFVPGSRLAVDALAIDPAQPEVLYVATSYLFGHTQIHSTPNGVAMSIDGAVVWTDLSDALNVAVVDLLPVTGKTGSVYALTTSSRTPLALGNAPVATAELSPAAESQGVPAPLMNWGAVLAWIVAGLAALALIFAVATDLRRRGGEQPRPDVSGSALETQTVSNER